MAAGRRGMGKFKTLLLAHHGGDNHAIQLVVKQFSENVTQRTGGQIAIATVPNSSLGNVGELLRYVREGTADMALPPYDRLGADAPRFGCVSMPFVFDDPEHADRVLDSAFMAWARPDLEALDLVLLGSWEWGFRQLSNARRPILEPGDLRGLKIRVPPVPPYRQVMQAFGATPVLVEFARLQSVIEQGLIDGQENPLSVIYSLGLQRSQRYLSLLNYCYGILGHVINRDCFERLSTAQRDVLLDESQKAGQLMRKLARSQEMELLDRLASQGMEIVRPAVGPFKALMAPVYLELAKAYGEGVVREFLDTVDEQRKLPAALAT
jgi:TRAP-type transport system periplasmic protein